MDKSTKKELIWLANNLDVVLSTEDPRGPERLRALEVVESVQRVLLGEKHLPPPSVRARVTAGGSSIEYFYARGAEIAKLIHQWGNIREDSVVLDVGCGNGRIALPMHYYVRTKGKLICIDADPGLIEAAKEMYGRFIDFRHVDVKSYRFKKGTHSAEDFRFEFDDEYFDCIYLHSVFTHMKLPEIEGYLKDFRRILKPGGRVVFSTFIWSDEKIQNEQHKSRFIKVEGDDGEEYWTLNPDFHQAGIAYSRQSISRRIENANLKLVTTVDNWGKAGYNHWHDYVVCEK